MMPRILMFCVALALVSPVCHAAEDGDSLGMSVKLKEVEVRAAQQFTVPDGVAYIPMKLAKEASIDVYNLIQRTGISGVRVEDKKVMNLRDEAAVFFIDGVEATKDDVAALLPSDVSRIEVLNYPQRNIYRGIPFVISITTKPVISGGYIVADASQTFINNHGDYSVLAKGVKGRSVFQGAFSIGESWSNRFHGERTESYSLTDLANGEMFSMNRIVRYEEVLPNSRSISGVLSWKYSGNKTWYVNTRAGIGSYARKSERSESILEKETERQYTSNSRVSYLTPYISSEFRKLFNNGSMLFTSLELKAAVNNSNSDYSDSSGSAVVWNRSHENVYSAKFAGDYNFQFRNNASAYIRLRANGSTYKVNYQGSADVATRTTEGTFRAIAGYNHPLVLSPDVTFRFGSKIEGGPRIITNSGGNNDHAFDYVAILHLVLDVKRKHNISLLGQLFNNGRPLKTMNDVWIKDTEVSGHRGNPNVKDMPQYIVGTLYSWLPCNEFNMSYLTEYSHTMRAISVGYSCYDDIVYSQIVNSGVFSWLRLSLSPSLRLFNNSLIVSAMVNANKIHKTGIDRQDFWAIMSYMSVYYMMKKGFSLNANVMIPSKQWYDFASAVLRKSGQCTFSIGASYSVGNFKASIDVSPLHKWNKMTDITRLNGVDILDVGYNHTGTRYVTLKLNYILDFGRRYPHADNVSAGVGSMTIQ